MSARLHARTKAYLVAVLFHMASTYSATTILQFFHSLVIHGDLLVTNGLYLLIDEDVLKKLGVAEGASGPRPCLRCNAVARGRGAANLPGIEQKIYTASRSMKI